MVVLAGNLAASLRLSMPAQKTALSAAEAD
jgi:hypothetical protein